MQGLRTLTLSIDLLKSYMQFIKAEKFCIEDFKNSKPCKVIVSVLKDNKTQVYELYLNITDSLIITDENDTNCLLKYAKENNISSAEVEKQNQLFKEIIANFLW